MRYIDCFWRKDNHVFFFSLIAGLNYALPNAQSLPERNGMVDRRVTFQNLASSDRKFISDVRDISPIIWRATKAREHMQMNGLRLRGNWPHFLIVNDRKSLITAERDNAEFCHFGI